MMYVYFWCMARVRTNIEIEDEYVEVIKTRYHLRTKTEAVDLALRKLAGEPMSKADAMAMRGSKSIGKIPADRGPRGGSR
jgi:Arc/MetJ family transcription regulator